MSGLPLSHPPPAGTTYAAPNAALGYLHANCGHCHNHDGSPAPVPLRLAQAVDTRALLPAALEQGVAFMPGEYFYADDEPLLGTLRLNFSYALPEQMSAGWLNWRPCVGRPCEMRRPMWRLQCSETRNGLKCETKR